MLKYAKGILHLNLGHFVGDIFDVKYVSLRLIPIVKQNGVSGVLLYNWYNTKQVRYYL